MPRPCNASPSACTSARGSQRSSRSWTRSSTAWLSGYARAKHSVSCSELSSLPLRQRARPQARRSTSRSVAASGPKVSRSLASRRMARARWGTRRVLLTRASLFAGDAVLLHHAVEVVAIGAREVRGFAHVVLCALEQGEHVALLEGVAGGWRPRHERPGHRRTAEQRDEVATFYVDHGGLPPRCAIRAADWPVLSRSAASVPRPSLGFLPDVAYPPIGHAMAHSGRASPGAIRFIRARPDESLR